MQENTILDMKLRHFYFGLNLKENTFFTSGKFSAFVGATSSVTSKIAGSVLVTVVTSTRRTEGT